MRAQRIKFIFVYGAFFLLGLVPLILDNIQHAWLAVDFIQRMYLYRPSFAHYRMSLSTLFLDPNFGLNGLLFFENFPRFLSEIFTYGYEFIYLFFLLLLAVRKRAFWTRRPEGLDMEAFALLYQAVLLLLIFVSNFYWGIQYVFPILPFMMITIVLGLKDFKPVFRYGILSFYLLAGLWGSLSLVQWDNLGRNLHLRGYSYQEVGELFRDTHYKELDFNLLKYKVEKMVENREPEIKRAIYQGISKFYDFQFQTEEDFHKIFSFIQEDVEEAFRPIFFERFGIQLGMFLQFDPQKIQSWVYSLPVSSKSRQDIYVGVVYSLIGSEMDLHRKMEAGFHFCEEAPLEMKAVCYEGAGAFLGVQPSANFRIDPAYLDSYYVGLGKFLALFQIENPLEPQSPDLPLLQRQRQLFYQGYVQEMNIRMEDPGKRAEYIKELEMAMNF